MSGRWAQKDMMNQNRRKKRQKRHWGLVALGVFGVILVGFLVFRGGSDESEVDETVAPETLAFVEAWTRVDTGIDLAREVLDSGEAEVRLEAQREAEALQANWEEGETVVAAGELAADESVFLALQRREIPSSSIHFSVNAMGEEFNFRRSRPGDQWRVEVDEKGRITEFRYQTSPEDIWVTTRVDQGEYSTEKLDINVEVRHETIAGTIESSFWLALEATGESGALAHRFMRVFQYAIDFNVETRGGDHFAMVFERVYLDDEFLRYGRILAAQYIGEAGNYQAFYFESDEESGYFDAEGESLQRQFLRSPLEVTRVTSRFGRRVHPITGDSRMHRGVDYGAPTGTRVQAVADGTVAFAGWRGGYGKLLILRHSGGYETRYAHLSRFGNGIRAGARVSRGQIVARSGNTGASTAPHLHYEMLRNGAHINPLTVDATRGEPLRGDELATFRQQRIEPMNEQLHEAFQGIPEAVDRLIALDTEDTIESR